MLIRFDGSGSTAMRCIFCGEPNLTREHIFSGWMRDYFKHIPRRRAFASFGRVYPDRTNSVEWTLPGPLRDWEVKNVCGGLRDRCNTGWMKDIDDTVRPILLPLIKGEAGTPRLVPHQLEAIATWAVLKAMVVDRAPGSSWAVHHMHRRYMFKHRRAPLRSWAVWIGRYQRNIWGGEWVSRPFHLLPRSTRHSRRLGQPVSTYNSNSITQVIGEVLIHVVHAPDQHLIKTWRYTTPEGDPLSAPFFKIWPPADASVVWPSVFLTDRDADLIAVALSKFLNERIAKMGG